LSRFNEQGIMKVCHRDVRILEPAALEALVNSATI
jgi:hypothetical protein